MKIVKFKNGQCERERSYLDSYLSNELTVETNLEVLKHLEGCEECRRALDDRARIKAQLKRTALHVQAPALLRERIRSDIRRTHSLNFVLPQTWILTAAAAAVVLAVMLGVFFRSGANLRTSHPQPLSLVAEIQPGDVTGQILKVGFDDHVYCAVDHGTANQRFTGEEMAEKLGPQYQGLLEVAREKMPQDFEIVVGHRCHYQNREFVHLVMRRNQEVASLIVTRKNGEAFPALDPDAAISDAGVHLHNASWHNLQVTGFETRDHLVFVISNERKRDNEMIASRLMPAVGQFLKRIEV